MSLYDRLTGDIGRKVEVKRWNGEREEVFVAVVRDVSDETQVIEDVTLCQVDPTYRRGPERVHVEVVHVHDGPLTRDDWPGRAAP